MARPLSYFLSDVDGVLCVAISGTDYAEPRFTVSHYPTQWRTRDFLRAFEITADKLRGGFDVRETFPGEYAVTLREPSKLYQVSYKLSLPQGGKTLPVATTFEPAKPPRVGKGTWIEWDGGRWRIVPPKGKPRMVDA